MEKCCFVDEDELTSCVPNENEKENNAEGETSTKAKRMNKRDAAKDKKEKERRQSTPRKRKSRKSRSSVEEDGIEDNDDENEDVLVLQEVDESDLKRGDFEETDTKLEMKSFLIVPYSEVIQNDAGFDGWHCEGSILRTLFGVLMFPVMYSSQKNLFLTPYQDGPLDFPYPSYYALR
jgi:hypothetical protein